MKHTAGMKILLVGKQDISLAGGVETTLRLFSKELTNEGHEVAVLYFDRKTEHFASFLSGGIRFFVAPVRSSRLPAFLFRNYAASAERAISVMWRTFKPDQIWSRYAIATEGIISNPEFRRSNARILQIYPTTAWFQHQANRAGISLRPFWRRPLLHLLGMMYYLENKRTESLVVKSEKVKSVVFSRNMQARLSRESGCPADQLKIVRPGIDSEVFNGEESADEQHKMEQAFRGLPPKFAIYAGRLEINKNVDLLIRSFRHVKDLDLVIAGEGAEKAGLIRLAERLQLKHRIFFAGHQSDALKYLYRKAEFTVLPTRIESFGIVLLESLACGTPVIAFGGKNNYTAADEIILHPFNGSVVHEFTPEALGKEMNRLSRLDPSVKAKNRELNIDYIQREWNVKEMVSELLREGEIF